ncbi:hypothetical protein ACPT9H_17890 [Brevibacillus borstelensis]|uniref:hypothetical protein n=1 Tax=Brevibacillus borstelensis TaxID=45462 RepID=UPI003CE4FDFF
MSRKRRYYREDRRPPQYYDEYEEDDFDDDADTDRFVKKTSWGLLAVLSFGVLLSIAHSLYVPAAPVYSEGGYRVVSVSRGRVHVEEVGTGKRVSFDDQKLVKAALDGSIKRGDVIYR